jgi:hypothetical protein
MQSTLSNFEIVEQALTAQRFWSHCSYHLRLILCKDKRGREEKKTKKKSGLTIISALHTCMFRTLEAYGVTAEYSHAHGSPAN